MSWRSGPILALAAITSTACGHSRIRIPGDALVVRNGSVIDGTGRPRILGGLVAVQGQRILAVGPADAFDVPGSVTVVDARGGTILPGVVNSHTHSTHSPAVRRAFLVDGVTTVCHLGTTLDRFPIFDSAYSAEGPAARVYWAGPIVTAPGGYPGVVLGSQFNYEVASPEQARAAVADLLRRGASMIKIALAPGDPRNPWPIMDLERVRAIVTEAHARGVPVRAHIFEPFVVEDIALPAGIDVIEHEPFPILTPEEESRVLGSDQPLAMLLDSVAPQFVTLMRRVIRQGIVMVPTLDQRVGTLFAKPNRSPVEQTVLNVHVGVAGRFHALGGTLAIGNDFGGVGHVAPGMPLVEMRLFLAAGLTPMEVLEASTRHAAAACGLADSLGTLEAGKLADILIVNGNPLANLAAMDSIVAVIKGGELAFRAR